MNGGIIAPVDAVKGLTGLAQFNYSLTPAATLYIYSGYSRWDEDILIIRLDYTEIQTKSTFRTFTADKHILIPVFAGGKIDMHSTKYFTSFLTAEVGYAYIKYNTYKTNFIIDEQTGEVLDILPDLTTRKEETDHRYGIGIGAGLYHNLTDNLQVILSYKLNTFISRKLPGVLSSSGTQSNFLAGMNLII
jgi:opacity protein-like surface antigen